MLTTQNLTLKVTRLNGKIISWRSERLGLGTVHHITYIILYILLEETGVDER